MIIVMHAYIHVQATVTVPNRAADDEPLNNANKKKKLKNDLHLLIA